jgi:L-fuconolactonase
VKHGIDHDAWLARTHEEALEPRLPICDCHHHLWDGPGNRGRYLVDDFLADASGGHRVVGSVFAECGAGYREEGPVEMRPVGEMAFVESITATRRGEGNNTRVAAGMVAFADLTLGDAVDTVVAAHVEASGHRLRSVRQSCTWDPDPAIVSFAKGPGMMGDEKFREGFACLARHGLLFDAWQYYTQLPELADLARAFSETTIVVNHAGGPLGVGRHAQKRQEVLDRWKKGIEELSAWPNVMMKLGGLGMARCGFGWSERNEPPGSIELAAAMAPYLRFCIDAFGVGRCMFESNFPVDRESYSYTVLWNAFKRFCDGYSDDDKKALFCGNAVRIYRLDEEEGAV